MKNFSSDKVFSSLEALLPAFFLQEIEHLAYALLNCVLFTYTQNGSVVGGRIVETESYTQEDEASHSYKGQTQRVRAMFMPGGTVYVYLIYGMHYCCNVVAGLSGQGNAVLLRALEPYWGLDTMAERRSTHRRVKAQNETNLTPNALCRGPGCLSKALGINNHTHNETQFILTKTRKVRSLYLMQLPTHMHIQTQDRVKTTRIGITTKSKRARTKECRFYIQKNPCVSYPLKT